MLSQQLFTCSLLLLRDGLKKASQNIVWSKKDEVHKWVLQNGVLYTFMPVRAIVSALWLANNQKKTKLAILVFSVPKVQTIPK